MNIPDRIAEIRTKPYNKCTYDELIWALDEIEKERKRSARFIKEARDWMKWIRRMER